MVKDRKRLKFTHIAVTGLSGLLVGPSVASLLGKEILVIRKDVNDSPSKCQVEFSKKVDGYVILDDLIETGKTVNNIISVVQKSKDEWDETVNNPHGFYRPSAHPWIDSSLRAIFCHHPHYHHKKSHTFKGKRVPVYSFQMDEYRDYMNIGPSPATEDCAQFGSEGFHEQSKKECRAFIRQLRRQFGKEPIGASLIIKSFPYEGTVIGEVSCYREVVCVYHENMPETVDYAFKCESSETWEEWDDTAKAELGLPLHN